MPTEIEWFDKAKQTLASSVENLLELNVVTSNQRLMKATSLLHERLQSFAFNLVVLGECKRGKSTLVNALLGANVLPTGVIPLTSITTIISHGEQTQISVRFQDGKSALLGIDQLEKYVTERGNPKNILSVDSVNVYYPAKLLRDGVRIVDTPGTGSINVHNTETTYSFLPEADAALFVFSADQPASINELKFLHDAKSLIERFFFVQNKMDILTDQERSEALRFLERSLSDQLGAVSKIYPVSARRALASKLEGKADNDFEQLEQAIFGFLANEKARTFIVSVGTKIARLSSDAKQLLELEIKTGKLPGETMEHGLKIFKECSDSILKEQNDVEHIVLGETRKLIKAIEDDLYPLVERNIKTIKEALTAEFAAGKNLSKDELIEAMQTRLRNEIAAAFATWKFTEEELVSKQFSEITSRFAKLANSIVAEINAVTLKLFDIEFEKTFEVESLTKRSRHYYAVDNPFTLSMQIMPLLLPAVLAKNIIKDRFINAAQNELSRNAGRLRADMQERIETSAKQFLKDFRAETNGCLDEISSAMSRAAASKQKSLEEQADAEKLLKGELHQIEAIISVLPR
jgi:GTPase SAR1 family protein